MKVAPVNSRSSRTQDAAGRTDMCWLRRRESPHLLDLPGLPALSSKQFTSD